ncbi:secretory phospholipase A2 receptor-like isoform X1, partial [Silurus meridionalis]
ERKTWTDAQAYCKDNHTDLAIIDSNDKMIQLQNEAQRQQFRSSAWIGLYNDVNSWRWTIGNEPLGTLNKWGLGEPNNYNGNQECGAIHYVGLLDRACKETLYFIC